MDRRDFTRAFAALLAALLVAPAVHAQEALVVHHIGPFTGVLAASNMEAIDGARLYLSGLNSRGGVGGRAVQLQTLDDGQDPKRTREHFDTLVAQGRLLALMMPRTTPSMEALLEGVERHGVPVIGPQTGGSFVNHPPRREVFTLRASYQKEAEVAIRQQHSIGVRSFGLLLADDVFGRDTLLGINRTMKELGVEPVATARVDNRKPDVGPAVRQMLAAKPQVLLLIVSSKAAADFVKAYRAADVSATFISLSNTSNNDYVQALGAQSRGAIVMQILPSPFSPTTALAREYSAAAATAGQSRSYAGLYGFATAKLLALGLAKAGRQPTRDSLIQALEGLGEVDLGGFRLRYGPGQREGSGFVDSSIITHEGRFMR
jgi:ABC-type branched-subunit amino acid transport system substrate-binding protein